MNRPIIGIAYSTTPDMSVGLAGHMDSAGVVHIKEEARGSEAVAKMEQKYLRRLAWYNLRRRLEAGMISFVWPKS